ncbi:MULTISPECIES: electron transport complex subunit RsxD [Erwinia]|uniref:electron transport complex subunit RsxD n=1 Tax=Erwinia TaxID=551 RepID=UPI00105CBC72|nr:electron transport complex subunit RsxD [Erwinia rhapontici]MBP2155592.1 electron transport complex protein RnfD [Erwinia rhapontici]MCS3605944.1 electron transport complex protein RnfD [Erwinia rhapontici]TDS98453.1 electron transport complex protein RnfD [Erwinia rhapontici]UDQ82269.1 electron transport complex subunit RsxD [Erwinia rhapontici]
MAFRIASSPYTHNRRSTSTIMLLVLIAAVPGMVAQWYYFGWGNLIQVLIAAIAAIGAEAAILRLRKLPLADTLKDNSALLTALLLGISIPSLAPWWVIVIGTLFAVVISKQLYGGLGQNPFNPAMVGYVVLLISFPVQMTSWLPPDGLQGMTPTLGDTLSMIFHFHTLDGHTMQQLQVGIDGVSQATPLDTFKTGLRAGHSAEQLLAQPIYSGVLAGLGWQWVNVGYLLGGVFLLCTRSIRWHIPAGMLISLAFCATLGWLISPHSLVSPVIHLLSGATMLGAFFIATDPVTASTTNKGRLIYGALIGLLVWLIRSFGGYPDGVAFAVLLANICVPLIDYYTQPRVYGHRKDK